MPSCFSLNLISIKVRILTLEILSIEVNNCGICIVTKQNVSLHLLILEKISNQGIVKQHLAELILESYMGGNLYFLFSYYLQ